MSKAIFHGSPKNLRSPQRLKMMQVPEVVKHTLSVFQAASLLDIGTGTGVFAEAFQQHGLMVAGIDHNPAMLELAREFVPAGEFKPRVASEIPFEDKRFDVSFMGLVFHEVPDEKQTLAEAARVSRQGIAILEWQPKLSLHGPVLEKRIKPKHLADLCEELGLGVPVMVELDHLALYLIGIKM